ncbi:sensor histidine kinase [Algicola sagamiensis]|uniref:sensor histidine kinase n=1 Tax=Algicola sagamiensis TaxID=163869 RepID=UPI000381FC05|nr:ATP-binding protein [Algicola sagamiensis]
MKFSILTRAQSIFRLPTWLKSSAVQQGVMFGLISLMSLLLMASVTYFYVEYELDQQNEKIYHESIQLSQDKQGFTDDDPIEDDFILGILASGFTMAFVLVFIFTALSAVMISRLSQKRISRIETVLHEVSEGDLSARTGEQTSNNDLARISVAMDEMLSRLEGSVASMRDISSNIAHELKTPITRLQHNLLVLQEGIDKEDQVKQSLRYELEQALMESQRLAATFDALLRISQIESGVRRSRFTKLDITDVLSMVSEIYTDVAEDAGMALTVERPKAELFIQGDRELMVQQVANLIENALRYCPEGSQIVIQCGTLNASELCLQISDNGPGIPEAEMERVFERMYRVDKSRTDGGLGLGLSLVKAIASLHHGRVVLFDCQPGLGVKLFLPLVTSAN